MAWAFPWQWLARSPAQRPDLQIVVYTRESCPLCDEAWKLLQRYQKRFRFELEAIDIGESEELTREFGNCIPVVVIAGKVRFRGHVNEVLLQRILKIIHEGHEETPRD